MSFHSQASYAFLDPPDVSKAITPLLRVGIVPMPEFTLLSLSCLVDFFRHCGDESDFSRQRFCHWSLLSHNRQPIRSSCGFAVTPQKIFCEAAPRDFDFIVIHGGLLRSYLSPSDELHEYVRYADICDVPLVGNCTGSFVLAELGMLAHRRCAVHFTLQEAMWRLFPDVTTVADQSIVRDGRYITCVGGLAAINLAAMMAWESCGKSRVHKALHYLRTDRDTDNEWDVMHKEEATLSSLDTRVSNAVGLMRQHMHSPYAITKLARQVGTTERSLARLFERYLRTSPGKYWRNIRLGMARHLVINTDWTMMRIADECGFIDDSHLAKRFTSRYGASPASMRKSLNNAGIK